MILKEVFENHLLPDCGWANYVLI